MTSPAGPRVRIAVAGGGLVAQLVHLPVLATLREDFEVVALADPDAAVRTRVTARHGIPVSVDDHRALLALEPDAVLVCAPNHRHAEIVLDALDAGCHVLVEKPLCVDPADAERIVRRRDETGLVVQVGCMKRFDASYEALRDELEAVVPRVRHVASLTLDPGLAGQFAPAGFVAPPSRAADVLSDAFLGALVHDVNAVRGLIGDPAADAFEVHDGFADESAARVGGTVALPGGARWTLAWLLAPGVGRFEESLRIVADDGLRTLTFPAPYLRPVSATLAVERASGPRGSVARVERSHEDAYVRQWSHFRDCVRGSRRCRTPPEQALEDLLLLTRLHDAARDPEPVA